MNSFTDPIIQLATSADLIIEKPDDGTTYLCFIASGSQRSEEMEGENVWRIARYTESTNVSTGIKKTKLMYPRGSKGFNFNIGDIDDYDYKYSIN